MLALLFVLCACSGPARDPSAASGGTSEAPGNGDGAAAVAPVEDGEATPQGEAVSDDDAAADDDGWAAPAVAEEKPAASEGRSPEAIAAFVKERRKPIRDCVNRAQRKDPKIGGDLVLSFVLDPKGGVTRLKVDQEKTTFQSEEATYCILEIVKTWQFPASKDGMETKVAYPFTFNPKG